MTALERLLVDRIRRTGPMPFAAFMRFALYDRVHGYYAGGPRTGWRGDFVTAAEIDPAFGALWARAFTRVWRSCGAPGSFTIAEIGPGEGGFAAAVLEALPDDLLAGVRYILVERTRDGRERQAHRLRRWDRIEWIPSVVDLRDIGDAVVFANEVLDNAPVHVVERREGRLMELNVTVEDDHLVETLVEPSSPELEAYLDRCGIEPAEGARYEIGLAAEAMARRLGRILRRGAVILVDYGAEASELARRDGTLVCYSRADASDDVLSDPGDRDITSHVNWTAVAGALRGEGLEVIGPLPQAEVLQGLGIGEIDRGLRATHDEALAAGRGSDAVASLSRRHALRTLTDPAGMGGFGVLAGARGIRLSLDA